MKLTLKAMRSAHDKNITKLAEEIGIDKNCISQLEKEERKISKEQLAIYSKYFNIDVEEIEILFLYEAGGASYPELMKMYLERFLNGQKITFLVPKVFMALRMLELETVAQLSEKIKIPFRHIAEYEEGTRMPNEEVIEKYCKYYNISKRDLTKLIMHEMKGYSYKQIVKEYLQITEKQE